MLITLMAAGTAALDAMLIAGITALFHAKWRAKVQALSRAHGRLAIFLLSLVSVAGTLWMQYGDNLAPCLLCWWQRVFMYPIPIIAGIAIAKDTAFEDIADYILGLSIFGAAVALYQHLLQILPAGALIPCSASDECAVRSVFEFGFVTLPWMALSVFAVFVFLALAARRKTSA